MTGRYGFRKRDVCARRERVCARAPALRNGADGDPVRSRRSQPHHVMKPVVQAMERSLASTEASPQIFLFNTLRNCRCCDLLLFLLYASAFVLVERGLLRECPPPGGAFALRTIRIRNIMPQTVVPAFSSPQDSPLLMRALALVLFAMISSPVAAEQTGFKLLNGAQIRAALSNKYVTDDAHWLHHYLPDGRLVHIEKGRENRGWWAVRNNQLCVMLSKDTQERECFDVYRQGNDVEYRDKGQPVAAGSIRSSASRSN